MADVREFGKDPKLHLGIDQALSGTSALVRDALGRVLEEGDEVLLLQPAGPWRVSKIAPVVHPGAPPNLMLVTCVTLVQVAVQRNGALEGVYRTRTGAEVRGKAQEPSPEPPPADDGGEPRP